MAGVLIRDCAIVTMNAARETIPSGDIHIEGSQLAHVGAPLPAVPAGAEVIDGQGTVALPGFINTHHHLYHPILRGLFANLDLVQWIQRCVLPTTPLIEPEHLYWGARLSLAECVESGVTSTIDWAYCLHSAEHAAAVLDAVRESGVRVHFAYGPSLVGGNFDLNLRDVEQIRSRYFGGGRQAERLTLWLGTGGPNYQPEERVRAEMRCAQEWGLSVHLHLAEHHTQKSDDALRMLERCGALGPKLLLAHAIHLSDADLDILARTGTKVSYNPLSNMRLATGICRATEMWQRGVDVGLGLDSAGASDNHDYFVLLRVAAGLQRAYWLRGDALTVADVLEMATIRGARCLGEEHEVGTLEKGKQADLILIEPRTINFMPLNDFESQLVFCAQPRNVDTVIVAGQVLKRKGELVGVDVDAIMAKCDAAARRVMREADIPVAPLSAHPHSR